MAAGAAGLPGAHALEAKGQEPEAAITPPPAEVVNIARDCRWNRSPVMTQTSNIYSKNHFI